MTRWPLLLPPPAVSTSPSRLRRSSLSIVVKSPSRRSSPSSCRRAVYRRSAEPSITDHSPLRCPSPPVCSQSIAAALALSHAVEELSRAVPRHQGAVALSLTIEDAPSLAVKEPVRRLSPSRSRCAAPRRQGAVTPCIAVEEPSRRTSSSRSRRPC